MVLGDLRGCRRPLERYPVIGINIIRHFSGRLQAAERELEAMAYQRVDQRLARKLIDLGARFGIDSPRGTSINARLTQQELAAMVRTTRGPWHPRSPTSDGRVCWTPRSTRS